MKYIKNYTNKLKCGIAAAVLMGRTLKNNMFYVILTVAIVVIAILWIKYNYNHAKINWANAQATDLVKTIVAYIDENGDVPVYIKENENTLGRTGYKIVTMPVVVVENNNNYIEYWPKKIKMVNILYIT